MCPRQSGCAAEGQWRASGQRELGSVPQGQWALLWLWLWDVYQGWGTAEGEGHSQCAPCWSRDFNQSLGHKLQGNFSYQDYSPRPLCTSHCQSKHKMVKTSPQWFLKEFSDEIRLWGFLHWKNSKPTSIELSRWVITFCYLTTTFQYENDTFLSIKICIVLLYCCLAVVSLTQVLCHCNTFPFLSLTSHADTAWKWMERRFTIVIEIHYSCELTRAETLIPPADSPKIVTDPGSPPKCMIFSWIHRRAATWSKYPQLPRACSSPVLQGENSLV